MKTSGCRIGKVKIKDTGQVINVVKKIERTKVAQSLIDDVFACLQPDMHPNPRAYLFIVFEKDGAYSLRMDAENFPLGYAGFAAVVKSCIERDIITNAEIKWFCKRQGWYND